MLIGTGNQSLDPEIRVVFQMHTISNPDGTMSTIYVDTGELQNSQVVTLADGTQAHVVQTVSHLFGFTKQESKDSCKFVVSRPVGTQPSVMKSVTFGRLISMRFRSISSHKLSRNLFFL